MKKRKKTSWFKGLASRIGTPKYIARKRRARQLQKQLRELWAEVDVLNADIDRINLMMKDAVKEAPVEVRWNKEQKRYEIFNPNKSGNCSAYVTRIAENFFRKKFARADAGDFALGNRVVVAALEFDRDTGKGCIAKEKLDEMIKKKQITPGTIIGVFYTKSPGNRPERPFTHMMVYAVNNVFWHNVRGPEAISLEKIYSAVGKTGKRLFYPVRVFEPKR